MNKQASQRIKRFYFFSHQQKEKELANALVTAGWRQSHTPTNADILFSDGDHPSRHYDFQKYTQRGKSIFGYPHAGRPNLFNDFDSMPISPYITADFIPSNGHAKVQQAFGVERPFESIGWWLCPMHEFQSKQQAYKILFAPIHPNANGSLSHIDKQINSDTFKILLKLLEFSKIELTVRHLQLLERNGLWRENGVRYVLGQADQTYQEIDEADLVVTHQTMQYITVARGVPTVGMGESIPPRIGCVEQHNFSQVKSFDKYKDILAFPLDILTEPDTLALFERTIASDTEIVEWRARMIGEPFDAKKFVERMESYL